MKKEIGFAMNGSLKSLILLIICVLFGIACNNKGNDETEEDEGTKYEDGGLNPFPDSREITDGPNRQDCARSDCEQDENAPDEQDKDEQDKDTTNENVPDERDKDEQDNDASSEDPECSPERATEQCYAGPLSTRGVGICQSGTRTCADGEWGPCEGLVTQKEETCDGRDEDCDGETDEDLSLGYCVPEDMTEEEFEAQCLVAGFICENGSITCKVDNTQIAEHCNDKDDDCGGETEEDLDTTCYTGSSGCNINGDGSWECQGICRTGKHYCIDGKLSEQCEGEVTPLPSEVCYVFPALDDDCDGEIDEDCESYDVHLIEGDPSLCNFSAISVGPELTLLFDTAFVQTELESSDIDKDAFLGCKIEVGFTMLRSLDDNYYASLISSIQSGFVISHGGTATIDAHVDINGHPAHEVVQTWNSPTQEAAWLNDTEVSLAPVFSKSDQCIDDLQHLSGKITIRFDLSSHGGANILGIDTMDLRFTEDWCDAAPSSRRMP